MLTAEQVRKSAKRLAEFIRADWGIQASSAALIVELLAVLDYVADGPADEDESVTAGWLQSCGWVEFGLGLASVPGVESEGHQMTRGELRRLCAALGVPLTEATP